MYIFPYVGDNKQDEDLKNLNGRTIQTINISPIEFAQKVRKRETRRKKIK